MINQTLQEKYPHLELTVQLLSQVYKDNESKRIDSEYFKKEYLENEKTITSDFIIANFLDFRIKNIKNLTLKKNFQYLQIGDVNLINGLDYSSMEIEYTNIPDRATYVLKNNDICISNVRPNRNAVALINKPKRLIGTSGFTILRLKNKNIVPQFLYVFCKTNFFLTRMMRVNAASLYPAILDSDIYKMSIPILPMCFQKEIEKMVKDSYKALEESKNLYKKAQDTLYLSLGLNPDLDIQAQIATNTYTTKSHTKDNKANNETQTSNTENKNNNEYIEKEFQEINAIKEAVKSNDIIESKNLNISIKTLKESFLKTGRLDSEYYQIKYENLMCFIKNIGFCKLKDIGEFQNGSFIPEALYTDKAKRAYIRIKELSLSEPINLQESVFIKDEFSATNETIVREGDFVIATIGSIGKTNLITKELDGSFISNNTIRFRLFDNINLEFMEILLRSVFIQEQIQREATQTIQAKISKDSLQNILIPIIDSNIQQQISSYIKESFTLRQKSKDLLKEAVEKVEKAIAKGEY